MVRKALLRLCPAILVATLTAGQDFITSGDSTDPSWARLINAAQYVVAARGRTWTDVAMVEGFPQQVTLSTEFGGAVAGVACLPDRSVTVVFQASDLVNTEFVEIPPDFFINIDYQVTTPSSSSLSQPQVDKWVYESFMSGSAALADIINTCTRNETQLLTMTGSLLGSGAFAGVAALWASQEFPGATVSCITFDSPWSHIKVDQAFVRVFVKAVGFQRNTARPVAWYAGAQKVESAGMDVPGAAPCTLNNILCKVEPQVEMACLAYNPSLFAGRYPGVALLVSGFDRVGILWFEPISTAVFVFVNLENIFDSWLNPTSAAIQATTPFFSQRLLNMDPAQWGATYTLYRNNLGGDPMVYTQFATAFENLQQSTDARLGCTGLLSCLNALSARTMPTNIILTGHGMGGAYAMIGGTWAAVAFPRSTIQVTTAGAPAVIANNLYYVMFNALVGTPSNLVNGRDPVPRYPACLTGVALGLQGGLYINNTLLEMQNVDPWQSEFQPCGHDLAVKDQDCSLYLNSLRRVTKVRVDIGIDAPLGGVTDGTRVCPLNTMS